MIFSSLVRLLCHLSKQELVYWQQVKDMQNLSFYKSDDDIKNILIFIFLV